MPHFLRSVICVPILASLFPIAAAQADPITFLGTGSTLVASGEEVLVQFAGSAAAFDSMLYLSARSEQGPYFPNHGTVVGDVTSLGVFAAGSELMFRLPVLTTGDEFFTGPAGRNPDNLVHAQVSEWLGSSSIPLAGLRVGFEDLRGGGDMDFDDFEFVVSGAKVADAAHAPEPATLLLVLGGAAVVGRRRWRRVLAPDHK